MQLVHAQNGIPAKPDYNYIQKVTADPASPMNYSRLFTRYINDDTSLTQQEFQLLYYGYFFQDEYDSYNSGGYKDSLREMSRKESLTLAERKKMISFAKRDLKFTPFDLNDLNWLCNLYYTLNDVENYALYKYKVSMVAKTILASGDGRSDSTGLHVLFVSDEYNMLALLGFKYKGRETNAEKKVDYLTVADNSQGIKGVYFDVSQIFEGYTRIRQPKK
jgi:hypothetical protein